MLDLFESTSTGTQVQPYRIFDWAADRVSITSDRVPVDFASPILSWCDWLTRERRDARPQTVSYDFVVGFSVVAAASVVNDRISDLLREVMIQSATWDRTMSRLRTSHDEREEMLTTVLSSLAAEDIHIDRDTAREVLWEVIDGEPLILLGVH
jgi:hypothetical protein